MDIFGIGILEILFILLIALIVLGPADMVKTGRTLGKFLRKIVTSPNWGLFQKTSQELRELPTKLIREAGLEEFEQEMQEANQRISPKAEIDQLKTDFQDINKDISSWITPPALNQPGGKPPASSISQDSQNEHSEKEE